MPPKRNFAMTTLPTVSSPSSPARISACGPALPASSATNLTILRATSDLKHHPALLPAEGAAVQEIVRLRFEIVAAMVRGRPDIDREIEMGRLLEPIRDRLSDGDWEEWV